MNLHPPLAFLQREAVAAPEIGADLQRTVGNAGVAGRVVADASLLPVLFRQVAVVGDPPVQHFDGLPAGERAVCALPFADAVVEVFPRVFGQHGVAAVLQQQYPDVGAGPHGLSGIGLPPGIGTVGAGHVVMYAR